MRRSLLLLFLCLSILQVQAKVQQINPVLTEDLVEYIKNYVYRYHTTLEKTKIDSVKVDEQNHVVHLFVNASLAMQPFTPEVVDDIYSNVRARIAEPFRSYGLVIYSTEHPIQSLVPIDLQKKTEPNRTWGDIEYDGNPWVKPLSLPYTISKGLYGRHICAWASHGSYYNQDKAQWMYQRPHLYCTTEDLFTQTFAIPYLYRMLENAGAVVYTPRERDWQKREVIVDNDTPHTAGEYSELDGKHDWKNAGPGFANTLPFLTDSLNPFVQGTCRMVKAQSSNRQVSTITWLPVIPEEGDYAVYVSYKTTTNSVSDAKYTVRHQGIATRFSVNQTMGGGIWVYLGHFHFSAGQDADNCVILTNQSDDPGVVTADAVRFGGGMSNILRSDTLGNNLMGSGLPRFLEGARYSAQWSGLPYKVFSAFELKDDYSDDIRVRPTACNYVANGSVYHPGESGLCVPIEMSLAIHSDAGVTKDMSHIGTLGIYTSQANEGITSAGLSRLTSRDLIDMIMNQINRDLTKQYGYWNRRSMWDRNYGETREPHVPGVILEMFSHQNFSDMVRGHDPYFKFIFSRAVYKAILRYISAMHGCPTVVQPLPVQGFSVHFDAASHQAILTWSPTPDPLEPTAEPTSYVVYTAAGENGYDNGTLISSGTSCSISLEEGCLYRFRVAALNEGGRSFLSNELCAYYGGDTVPRILLVDGFQRVAGPQVVNTEEMCGFDLNSDAGVADVRTPGYCGYQQYFLRNGLGKESSNGTGFSGSELEGMVLAGNTHDFTTAHAKDILAAGPFTIASCSSDALNLPFAQQYKMIDLILGAQRQDGYSSLPYKTFPSSLQQVVTGFTQAGGSILVSGAYIASDMCQTDDSNFTQQVLKYQLLSNECIDDLSTVQGMNTDCRLYGVPNEQHYWIRRADALQPVSEAFPAMIYTGNGLCAASAYQGTDYRTMAFGFPLECIQDEASRRGIVAACLQFLLVN